MKISEELWGHIPLLHVYQETMDAQTPTVIMLHGHTSAGEHNLHYAYHLVNKGIRVLLPDALMHGKRSFESNILELNIKFWEIVMTSLKEIEEIYKIGLSKNIISENNVGLIGISMGGITASAALTVYPWIKTAAICMGVTSVTKLAEHQLKTVKIGGQPLPLTEEHKQEIFHQLSPFNLENKPEIFHQIPIIFWHGDQDPIVPIDYSYPFFEEQLQQSKAIYIKEKGLGHAVSRSGTLKVIDFVAQYLSD